ncbi:MAG TPA: nitroreductase family deazaflavin-dependent oxidoreductase [Candidatus Binatia bacterium]|nr:nitroreductase family deazaflavin-dependent oxidoreductase [Candidatus Binatia bacterium]
MHFPRFMRQVNRAVTNPVMGTFAWLLPPLAVIHHVGRKSGRQYRTPVLVFPTSAGFVIPLPYGRDVDWARNIVKARGCEIERMGRRVSARNPRVVGFKTAEPQLPIALRPLLGAADIPGYVLLERAREASRSTKRKS